MLAQALYNTELNPAIIKKGVPYTLTYSEQCLASRFF